MGVNNYPSQNALALQGATAARPAAGRIGRFYRDTDTRQVVLDDGSIYHVLAVTDSSGLQILQRVLAADKAAGDLPSTYPLGLSTHSVGAIAAWPEPNLTVRTHRIGTGRVSQVTHGVNGIIWSRHSLATDAWSPWSHVITSEVSADGEVLRHKGTGLATNVLTTSTTYVFIAGQPEIVFTAPPGGVVTIGATATGATSTNYGFLAPEVFNLTTNVVTVAPDDGNSIQWPPVNGLYYTHSRMIALGLVGGNRYRLRWLHRTDDAAKAAHTERLTIILIPSP